MGGGEVSGGVDSRNREWIRSRVRQRSVNGWNMKHSEKVCR